ncbi:MFS transporter [Streptomyces sp. NPDC005506]|uniref:MFS transporter n=1 Tax=unclassified Streptomyces TaxID=2593676 RepID=UPI003681ACEA
MPEPADAVTVRQRDVVPFTEIARVALQRYPRRALLGLPLFVGQAFLYNAIVVDLGTLMSGFFGVGSSSVPYFLTIFAIANFLGPLLLGRLFDTVGRKPMITGTYFGSAAVAVVLAVLLVNGSLTAWSFFLLVSLTFFVASAGASSGYLTVSEVFPMETRALSISLFFAVGTAVGGITGPLLFGHFIHSGNTTLVATGFFIGAAATALGGLAEVAFGVKAEQQSLENIARPLTAEEADVAWRGEWALPGRTGPPPPRGRTAGRARAGPADRRPHGRPPGARRHRGAAVPSGRRRGQFLLLAGDGRNHRRREPHLRHGRAAPRRGDRLGLLVLVCLPLGHLLHLALGEEVAVGTCSSSASAGSGPRALGRVIATPVGVTVGVLLNPVVARPSTWGLPARRPGTSRHGCGWCCGSATKWCTAPPPAM